MDNSALANRMKEYYEAIPKTRLMRRTPVAIGHFMKILFLLFLYKNREVITSLYF